MSQLNNITYVLGKNTLIKEHHYKFSTHRDHILTEIQDIHASHSQVKINLIIVVDELENINAIQDIYKFHFNSENLFLHFIIYCEDINVKIIDIIKENSCELIIYVNHENLINYLPGLEAIHISYEIGSFQKNPFPPSFKISHANKFLPINDKELSQIYNSGKIHYDSFFRTLRKIFLLKLSENLPLKISRVIDECYNNFEKVFLLPLDLFKANNNNNQLINLIENLISLTPNNVGLIVAEDTHCRSLDENIIRKFRLRYPNFVYVKDIPFAHDFISSYVDGIIADSTSAANLFSLLWRKPIFNFEIFSFNKTEFLKFINNKDLIIDNDYNLFKAIFTENIFINNQLRENYYEFLNKLYEARNNQKIINRLIHDYSLHSIPEIEKIILNNKLEWLAFDQIFKILNTTKYPDHFRIKLSKAKIISFDLFDTLVERDIANPADIFFLIECDIKSKFHLEFFNYKHFRCLAEENKRRDCNWKYEVTLDEIYDEFSRLTAIFTKAQVKEIKNLEMAYEMMFVKPKKKMIREFNFSSLFVDNKSIMSDIYLNNDQLSILLKNAGIKGYDYLLSSASYGHLKYTGKLFEIFLDKFKGLDYQREDFLHVGDNPISDGKSPLSYGLQSYTFNKSIDNYKYSCINQLLPPSIHYDSINQSILTGFIANKFYGNHQNLINYDSIFADSVYSIGYTAMGPLLFGFTQWLYRHVKKNNINKLFFLARDGWLLKKCFDLLYPNAGIRTTYLYCSRRAFKFVLLREWHDIVNLFDLWFDHSKLVDLLSVRYNISLEEIDPKILKKYAYNEYSLISRVSDRNRIISFLKEISPLILEKAAIARKDYLSYLNTEGFTEDPTFNTTAIVDIGYGASMQLNFMDLFKCENIHGYYFLTRNIHVTRTRFNHAILEGYLENFDDAANIDLSHPINKYIQVFESLLSSPEGTLVKVKENENKKFIFDLVDVENVEIRVARFKEIERGVLDFINDIHTRLPRLHLQAFQLSPILSSRYLMEFVRNPLIRDAKLLCEIDFEDDLSHNSSALIDTGDYNDKNQNIAKSAWKEGAIAIFSNELNQTAPLIPSKTGGSPIQLVHTANAMTHSQRMLRKLKKNPYMFFNDSKLIPVRKLSILFKPTSPQEKVLTPLLNRIIK